MSKKHMILMFLCCGVGMGAAAIFFFGIPVNRVFAGLMILICPLSHLLMMKFMMGGHQHGAEHPHPVQPGEQQAH